MIVYTEITDEEIVEALATMVDEGRVRAIYEDGEILYELVKEDEKIRI